jgi:predicted nucleic acid-binding protein
MRIFVDTNLLLDVLAKREPFYTAAARVWTLAETGACEALVSAISFNNVFYIVRKARDPAAARRALVLLRDVFASIDPDQRILNQAIDSDIPDLEDAIQFYSALHARADYLLTRNVGDFPAGILPVLAPDEFLALVDRAVDKSSLP